MFYEAEYQRVIYKKNPLVEVVCGISFPQLLEIGIEEPVEFQKAIRSKYPILKTQNKVFSLLVKVKLRIQNLKLHIYFLVNVNVGLFLFLITLSLFLL